MKTNALKLLVSLVVVSLLAIMIGGSAFADSGTPTPPNSYSGYGYGMMGGYELNRVANLLGMNRQDLTSQLQQGKTLVQVAQDKGVSEQQLIDTFVGPYKDELQLQVKYEYITQDQADSLVQQMTDRVKTAINGTWNTNNFNGGMMGGFGNGFGNMMSGYGGFGGMMNGFGNMMGGLGGMMNGFGGGHGGMMGGWRN